MESKGPDDTLRMPEMNRSVYFAHTQRHLFAWRAPFLHAVKDLLQVNGSAVVYRNQLFYAMSDPLHPFIIRQYNWTVGVECDIARNNSASAHVHHESSYTAIPYVSGSSRYGVNLTFYNDSSFLNAIPGNPLRVPVGTFIFVKVNG